MSEHQTEAQITAGPETGLYDIFALFSKASVMTTAQGLLEIAAWVDRDAAQLRKEAGQELTRYQVELRRSSIVRLDRIVQIPAEAKSAQEAASCALLQYGTRQMAYRYDPDVISAWFLR